jgi:hypothetical protein
LQHQVFNQHLFDASAEIGLRHNRMAILSQIARRVKRAECAPDLGLRRDRHYT